MMRGTAVVVMAVLALAACTDDAAPAGSRATLTTEAPAGGSPVDNEAANTADSESQTLAEFMGWEDGGVQEWLDEGARFEEAVRVCMAREGFDYKPVVAPEGLYELRRDGGTIDAERSGFGITTWVGRSSDESARGANPAGGWVDPNADAVGAMSEAEKQAWDDVLHGTEAERLEHVTVETDPETGEEIRIHDGPGAGCYGEASAQVFAQRDDATISALWAELEPAMVAMHQRVLADRRIVELDARWAACMAGHGHQVTTRDAFLTETSEQFQARLDVLLEEYWELDPSDGLAEEERESMWDLPADELDAVLAEWNQRRLDTVDRDALEALQAEEIALAADELDCRGDYEQVLQTVTEEYEVDFTEEHRSILLQIRQAEQG